MRPPSQIRKHGFALLALFCFAASLSSVTAAADARSDYLVRLLTGSTQFRVRAQAAISLGGIEANDSVVQALAVALRDEHPAVRAAAANSLGRLEDSKALGPLRSAANDPEPPVRAAVQAALHKLEAADRGSVAVTELPTAPAGPPRYYVAIAKPASRVPEMASAELDKAHAMLRERVGQLDGVVLAPSAESNASARDVLKARKLKGFYIDSSVTSVEQKPGGGTRVAVSVIVATYPDRAMRAIMQGAATAMGGGDVRAQALAGAYKSALSQMPQALSRE